MPREPRNCGIEKVEEKFTTGRNAGLLAVLLGEIQADQRMRAQKKTGPKAGLIEVRGLVA